MTRTAPERAKRTRRTGLEVRTSLLTAAVETFAERGFAGASTKEISQRAAVAEALLFRHFGNKAGLFEAAVLDPFEHFVDSFTGRWATHKVHEEALEDMVHDFVDMLYGFFEENKLLFEALLAARSHLESVGAKLDHLFDRLQQITLDASKEFGLPVGNSAVATRLSFGLIMSATVNGNILFTSERLMPREVIVDHLAGYVLHGIRMA